MIAAVDLGRIREIIGRHLMFAPGLRLGVAASAGADSTFLLHVLRELAPEWNLHLTVLHVNHLLRGPDSDADADFVRNMANAVGLPFLCREAAPAPSDNLEQAARAARLAFFHELISSGQLDRIATGHTLDDQAETVLYRLLRGAGIAGLRGILPVTREGLVRPLLGITRKDVVSGLTAHGVSWREDLTNQDLNFARNRIRHTLLPLIRTSFNPQVDAVLAHLAERSLDEEEFWDSVVPAVPFEGGCATFNVPAILSKPAALARRWLRKGIEQVKGDLRQVDFAHIETVLAIARSSSGSARVQLPGLDVFRSFDQIRIAPAGFDRGRSRDFAIPVSIPGSVTLPESANRIRFEVIDPENTSQVCDKVRDELDWQRLPFFSEPLAADQGGARSGLFELRNWRPGDHYRRAGHSEDEKIKTFFQNAHIPLWERRNWPVFTCAGVILWSRQFGAAAEFAANPTSRQILRIQEERVTEQ